MFYKNLLVYIKGYINEDSNELVINQINNYKYLKEDFIEEIKLNQEIDGDIDLYCVLGTKEDVLNIKQEIKDKINKLTNDILANKEIDELNFDCDIVEKNFYNLYIDSLIKDNSFRYPLMYDVDTISDVCCLILYSTETPDDNIEYQVKRAIEIFMQNEKPFFMGKQIMINSFLLQDIKDRKILSVLPKRDGSGWYALLEGGVKLYLDDELYDRDKISSRDIGIFTSLEIDSILQNPIYTYKKWFVPQSLFEEWNGVFLYALAVLPIKYDKETLKSLYEDFLNFIEENICDIIYADESIIDIDKFISILLINIDNIRKYIKGSEETGVSRNLLLLLKNKYVYLPTIYNIIKKYYKKEVLGKDKPLRFLLNKWEFLLDSVESAKSNYDKGIALEEAAKYFMDSISGLKNTGKRFKMSNEELDLVYCNVSENLKLWELGAVILVECKNWKSKVDTKVIRNLSYLMDKKGVSTIILFTKNSITKGAKMEIIKQAAHNKLIIVLDLKDLTELTLNLKPYDLLVSKVDELFNSIDNQMYLLM